MRRPLMSYPPIVALACLLGGALVVAPPAQAAPPAAKVKQLEASIKASKTIAAYIKHSLTLGHLYRKHKAYDKAIAVYRRLGQKYKKKDVQCVSLHFAAQTHLDNGQKASAHKLYRALIQSFKRCQCRYLPNAYIALGRHAFDQKQYKQALSLYQKAPRCRENRIAAVAAAYMKGWCAYKLKRYAPSLRAMLRALRELRKQQKRARGEPRTRLDAIQKEALPNLVRAFNRAGKPARAMKTFQQVASKAQVETMLKQLSDSYHTTKSYKKLLGLYQTMARAHRRSPRLVRDRLEILRAHYRLRNDRGQMRSLRALRNAIVKLRPKATTHKQLKADIADARDQLHRFAMGKHREAQRRSNDRLYRQSEAFFTAYRGLFPRAKDAHLKAYWHGEALLTLKKFARAAAAYTASATSKKSFDYKEDAAYKAALARHRLLNNARPLQYKRPASKDAQAKPLPKTFQAFIDAASLYRKEHPQGKMIPYVLYNIGLAYQQFGHFGKARDAFAQVVTKHPKTRYARPSAYHVIDTLQTLHDWDNLHKWSHTFATMSGFGTPTFKKQMKQLSQAAQTKRCFALDTDKKYAQAGQCYAKMAKLLGRHKDTPVLLYNAYVAFHNGKLPTKAQAMKAQLKKQYPRSRPARMLK